MMWLGGLFVLLSLAWVIAHTSGYGAEVRVSQRPPEYRSKLPSHRPLTEPPSGGPSLFGTNLEAIPSLVNEEDDLELTIVTASPSADMPASSSSAKPESSPSAPRPD